MLTQTTENYLKELAEWLPPNHPLAVAAMVTARSLDSVYSAAVMAQYVKIITKLDELKPASGQRGLMPIDDLIGPPRR